MSGTSPAIVLASGSAARAALLRNAGLRFEVAAAALDEAEIKAGFRAEGGDAAPCVLALAAAKAARVSRRRPGALVIGADQLLVCEGSWYDKPADMAAARAQLLALRGRAHELFTAVCVMQDGTRIWHAVERPRLVMRAFSDEFLDTYLVSCGEDVLASVGAYRLEDLGVQLFARIEGDFFSILGLPLLPLLEFLRAHGAIGQ
jgi:septum formation protein